MMHKLGKTVSYRVSTLSQWRLCNLSGSLSSQNKQLNVGSLGRETVEDFHFKDEDERII
jgi:hypothetical protein